MANKLISPVKKALVNKYGYKNVSVNNGKGTAWGWVQIRLDQPHAKDCSCEGYNYGQSCKDVINNTNHEAEVLAKKAIKESGQEAYKFYSDDGYNTEIDEINTHVSLV